MRDALFNNSRNFNGLEAPSSASIRFTGDAIKYLSSDMSINLNDWKWHEEYINGQQHCVITDKLSADSARC
ncbi:MAG TPA: hypothetical protein PKE30_04705 [Niabella sp.]|nr:hypothetical protein [Niabella sp.]